jgi:hypothetical protein
MATPSEALSAPGTLAKSEACADSRSADGPPDATRPEGEFAETASADGRATTRSDIGPGPSLRLRTRAYAAADVAHRRVLAAMRVLHEGWWLGVLDASDLDALARIQYARWPQYRDDAYNASGLRAWEAQAVHDHFPGKGALLVGAAGGGREIVALARLGYRVDAFDCVEPLVEYCRCALSRAGAVARVVAAAPGKVPAGLDRYDGLIVGWGGYMHIPGRARRVAFLRALRRHVDAGAPLLLSFFTRADGARGLRWTYGIARALRRLRRCADAVEIGDTVDGTFDHHFTRDEIERELAAGGFELVAYSESPYGHAVARAVAP